MRRRRGVAAAVLVAGVLAAACSSGGSDDAGDGDGAARTTTTGAGGGVLRMGVARLASLDPAAVSPDSPSASIAADLLFDGLTTLESGAVEATPALASAWASADGGRTWQFTIDRDATFSDGSAVTAVDAEVSLERVVSQGQASLTASRLDAVSGVAAFLAAGGRAAGADLAGISVIDPATVQVALDRSLASLPELLAAPAYGIVRSGETFDADALASSGPFRLAGRAGDVLTFTRAPGRTTELDGIELHQFDDLAVAYDRFVAGDLDWALVAPAAAAAVAEEHGDDGFTPFQGELFYGFNLADPRFADVRFRQAIVQAIDRDAIVAAVYPRVAERLHGVVPEGVPGSDPARCAAGCEFDQDAARALLAQAFPAGGVPEVPIDFPDGTDEAAVAGVIEQQLEAVGIPATLRPHPAADYSAFALSGQQGFASLGWIGVQATADDYLYRLFRTGSPDNLTGFTDGSVDALLDQAMTTLDPDDRQALLAQAEQAVLAAAPIAPIAQFRALTVRTESVDGVTLSITGTFPAPAAIVR